MLDTPLKTEHLRLRARMVPFAGWTMPVQYPEGIRQEHEHTRTRASVFDTCHMSEFRISGPGAVSGLDRLMARSTEDQLQGSCRYNFLMNERGGVLD
ncbi:MAG: glycine cleavage system aminomethyltransferase GcvT, partial [Thermodesulfobacteriota bacterium]